MGEGRTGSPPRLGALAIPALALFGIMRMTAGSIGSEGTSWFIGFKPIWPLRIMNGYNLTIAAATGLTLMVSLFFAARRGVLKLETAGTWLAIGFALLYVVIPSKLFGTSFVDLRVIPAAALILPAFCSLTLPSRAWRMAALAAISGVILINLAVVLTVWLPYRTDYAAIVESFHKIDRGSRILVASTDDNGDPPFADLTSYPMYYAPTLAVHYANAFVPNLFTEAGKQPVRPREDVRRLAIPYGGRCRWACLPRLRQAGRRQAFRRSSAPGIRTSTISMSSGREPQTRCRICWKRWTPLSDLFSTRSAASPRPQVLGRSRGCPAWLIGHHHLHPPFGSHCGAPYP